MHRYSICDIADLDTYKKQCAALEKHIPGLARVEELEDVDGSQYMVYLYENKKITVKNSAYLDEVCIDSEIPLEPFFK